MKIGYIQEYDLKLNPHLTEKFKFREELFTRHISSRGDKIRSKMLYGSVDYDEVKTNADIMKKNPAKRFEHESGLHPYVGTMAEESKQKMTNAIRVCASSGCSSSLPLKTSGRKTSTFLR